MDIFIDESGAFAAVPPAKPRFCAYTAVVVRTELLAPFTQAFGELRWAWGGAQERKGSSLTERQMDQALRLFRAYDATAFAAVIDTGMHPPEKLRAFREGQAKKIVLSLSSMRQPHPLFIKQTHEIAEKWRSLSDPLTMQLALGLCVVEDVIRLAPVYFAGSSAKENADFRWTVDAKGAGSLTNAESLWRTGLCPFLQTAFVEKPPFHVASPAHDYSFFDRSFWTGATQLPKYLGKHLKWQGKTTGHVFDLKRVMLRSLRFETSHNNLGLQVADIVGSALTRALNGTIQWQGWRKLGRLFLRQPGGPLRLIQLTADSPDAPTPVQAEVNRVFRRIAVRCKPMP